MKIKNLYHQLCRMKCFCFCFFLILAPGLAPAATSPFSEAETALNSGEKQFEQGQGEAHLNKSSSEKRNSTQKTEQIPWTNAEKAQKKLKAPETAEEARQQALQGSPETGYAGTWTDPATGDIITSVIAPTAPVQNNSGTYPIIVEPNVGNWGGYDDYNSGWSGNYPQWPVSPDNPGYGGAWNGPPPKPFSPPSWTGPTYYPYPHPPADFSPGYRPLRPGSGGNWAPGANPPPPGNPPAGTIPGGNWQPGNPPAGNWQPGTFPPSGNWQPGNNGQPGNPPAGNFPGGNWQPGNNGLPGNLPSGSWQPGSQPPPGGWQPGNPGNFPSGGNWGSGAPGSGAGQAPYWPGSSGNLGSIWHPGMDRPAFPGGISGIGWNRGSNWGRPGSRPGTPARPWR